MVVNERLHGSIDVSPRTAAFYDAVITALEEERLPFMLGGAFAFEVYTDIGGGRTRSSDPRNGTPHGLAPHGGSLRPVLAGPAGARRPVRLHLSGRSRPRPGLGARRAVGARAGGSR